MAQNLFFIVFEIANVLLLLITILFFIYYSKFKIDDDYKILVIYLFGASFVNITSEILRITHFQSNQVVRIFTLLFNSFHLMCLGRFIFFELKKIKQFKYYSFIKVLVILIYLIIFCMDINYKTYYSASVTNILLILLSVIYYYNLLDYLPTLNLKVNPSFLFITGIFFGSSLLTPILLFGKYLRSILNIENYFLISIIAPFASIIMYLFFLKSILCLRQAIK